jgi:hypothetical protein
LLAAPVYHQFFFFSVWSYIINIISWFMSSYCRGMVMLWLFNTSFGSRVWLGLLERHGGGWLFWMDDGWVDGYGCRNEANGWFGLGRSVGRGSMISLPPPRFFHPAKSEVEIEISKFLFRYR